jgi:hypothetical protein
MTGIEKIRQMSLEEFVSCLHDNIICPSSFGLEDYCQIHCKECWLKALNSEVEEE